VRVDNDSGHFTSCPDRGDQGTRGCEQSDYLGRKYYVGNVLLLGDEAYVRHRQQVEETVTRLQWKEFHVAEPKFARTVFQIPSCSTVADQAINYIIIFARLRRGVDHHSEALFHAHIAEVSNHIRFL
jgi:hypothetical protein